jgi:hypothetical protein
LWIDGATARGFGFGLTGGTTARGFGLTEVAAGATFLRALDGWFDFRAGFASDVRTDRATVALRAAAPFTGFFAVRVVASGFFASAFFPTVVFPAAFRPAGRAGAASWRFEGAPPLLATDWPLRANGGDAG